MIKQIILIAFMFSFISCNKSCDKQPDSESNHPSKIDSNEITPAKVDTNERVPVNEKDSYTWVYKYDGTLQCSQGREITIEEMKLELKDIEVLESKKAQDNLLRMTVCGAGTGKANLYKIKSTDVPKVKVKDFAVWNFGGVK